MTCKSVGALCTPDRAREEILTFSLQDLRFAMTFARKVASHELRRSSTTAHLSRSWSSNVSCKNRECDKGQICVPERV